MESELLRALIIVVAALNSAEIGGLDSSSASCGRGRYCATVYTAVASGLLCVMSVAAAALVRMMLSTGIPSVGIGLSVALSSAGLLMKALSYVSVLLGYEEYNPLIFFDAILLSTLILLSGDAEFGRLLLRAVTTVAYFIPAMLLFSRLRTRLDEGEAVSSFSGAPVMILTGAFLSLALTGILGITEKLFT